MKAIVHTQYGPPTVLQFKEVDRPAPKDNEVLIAIHATTVSTGDCNVRNFTFVTKSMRPIAKLMFGIGKPWKARILGPSWPGRWRERVKTLRDSKLVIELLPRPAWRAAGTLSTLAFLKPGLW